MKAALLACAGALLSGPAWGEELHLYTAADRIEAAGIIEAFEKDTGIDVRWVRLTSGEALTRVRAEAFNPQASVWFNAPFLEFMIAAKEGLFEPYRPQTFDAFPAGARDPEWRWVGAYQGVLGFASNPKLLARRGVPVPTSWKELLSPQLRGEVSFAYAYTSGTAYTLIATLVQLFGEAKAMEYLGQLDEQVHHYNRSGAACVTQVALGEVGVCIAFTQDILTKGVKKGYPVVLSFPQEGTGYEYGGVALIRGGPELATGRKFIDWLLGPRGQAMLSKWNKLPLRADVPAPTMEAARAAKKIDFDAAKAAGERRRIVDAWREVTGQ